MSLPGCLSLLTDYGLQDGFVGVCHGVVYGIAPEARIVDLSHLVPPGDLRRGSALLTQTVPYLPAGSVHVAVVDPGVGTARRALVLAAGDRLLVGPDNGLLPAAADALGGVAAAHEITDRSLMREPVSETFHGRDVFAPVAAHLLRGLPPEAVGPAVPVGSLVRLPPPHRRLLPDGSAEAEVLTVDRFGNVQTSLDGADCAELGLAPGTAVLLRQAADAPAAWQELPMARRFGDAAPGGPIAYLDSAGHLTLAVNGANAAARWGLEPGDPLHIRASPR